MTIDEFNNKWKDRIEDGHYGLAINSAPLISYLDEKFTALIRVYPGFQFSQIKSKFGHARFYSNIPMEERLLIEQKIQTFL